MNDRDEPPTLAERIVFHVQSMMPHATELWKIYVREEEKRRSQQELEAADSAELSADRWELYAMSSASGRVASPPGTGWLLYSLRLGSAPGEHGWAIHTVWKRRLIGAGSVEN